MSIHTSSCWPRMEISVSLYSPEQTTHVMLSISCLTNSYSGEFLSILRIAIQPPSLQPPLPS